MCTHRERGACIRAKKHRVLLHNLQGTVVAIGGGGDICDELRDVGPDAGFDAGAEFDGESANGAGGCVEFEAGADAEAENCSEDGVGTDKGNGKELEVAAIAEGR